jgi:MFS family permease
VTQSSYSRNIPLFIAFRVLFNARWYYPVLAVLFLDLGLSVQQYALLNVAWAAAIVGLEVPSGAMADYFGRKKMVVFASILMVIEMGIFAFAPRGNTTLLFSLFILNRLFSGAAEASASGADEALAYDSLRADGREKEWPLVLERLMRWQSAGFFVAMMLGAMAYDEQFLQRITHWMGVSWEVPRELAKLLPLLLTLGNAIGALLVTLNFREPPAAPAEDNAPIATPWKATIATGKWIWTTPLALALIFSGLCFDSIVRLFMTFQSSYFKVIGIPIALFGVIGSAFSLLGFVVPAIAKRMVAKWPMRVNFSVVALMVLCALIGASFITHIYGLLWFIPFGVAMSLTQFFLSHYLNQLVTDSRRRATVLSFRGLAFNLAYGGIGLMFAALTSTLSKAAGHPSSDTVFINALAWLPWYFIATLAILLIFLKCHFGKIPAASEQST